MGEHLASPQYQSIFKVKNMNLVRHLICEDLNCVTMWEADLRSSDDQDRIKRLEKLNRDHYASLKKSRSINS
jgi:hypothetical protein